MPTDDPDGLLNSLNPSDDHLLRGFADSLETVAKKCASLGTWGLESGSESVKKQPRLARVYINLDTTSPRAPGLRERGVDPDEHRTLSALEALFGPDSRHVVLVGEPGCGKSTFCQYVTLCLADRIASGEGPGVHLADRDVPELLQAQKLVPLRVLLRQFAFQLDAKRPGTAEQVLSFLRDQLTAEAAAQLPRLLNRGLALILFDGLDEVPGPLLRPVKQAIRAVAGPDYGKCRLAVTCRAEAYKRSEYKLEGFDGPHQIAPLSRRQQEEFVQAWYEELEVVQDQFKGKASGCVRSLLDALTSEELSAMAGNPFFLTAMAVLHRPDKPLPKTSAKLMDHLVSSVLEESRKRGRDTDSEASPLELEAVLGDIPNALDILRRRLQSIAYTARERRHGQDPSSRGVDEDLLKARLALHKGATAEWVERLIEVLRHRAGLLQGNPAGQFEFAYRFEEFLAGCHLANRAAWAEAEPNFVRRARRLLSTQGAYARKVVQWAAGIYAHVNPDQSAVKDLVAALTPARASVNTLPELELAADIASDARMETWQDEDVPHSTHTLRDLRARLVEVRDAEEDFPIQERSRAADALGRLGDLRSGEGLEGGLPRFEWCPLPAGEYRLGETNRLVRIGRPFQISRYPVTVEQFKAFVEQGGYGTVDGPKPDWWCAKGWQWRNGKADEADLPDWYRAEYRQEVFPILRPKDYARVFQIPNHPRVGVCWYEATAFCRWLSSKLDLPSDAIRLPHEHEWEWAARSDPATGRAHDGTYPWGESKPEDLARYCNWDKTGLGHTSAVGLFPKGQAGCEAFDLAGNVWEWCANEHEKYPGNRVLRGGSWVNDFPTYLSCSCRVNDPPVCRIRSYGFRCVWVSALVRAG